MWKKILVLSLLATLLLLLTSCISAETVVERVAQSLHEIDTYQYDMNISLSFGGIVDGIEGNIMVSVDSTGTVDNINRRMWAEAQWDMQMTPQTEEEEVAMALETYIIGNDVYMLMEMVGDTLFGDRSPKPVPIA